MIILLILLGLVSAALALVLLDLHRVLADLTYVTTHDTNAEVTTTSRWPLLLKLVATINAALRQNRQLKTQQARQEQQVQAMLTNLTHDIKTPLTVASGYVQLLQTPDPANAKLARIAHSLTAVNYYLRYLMDFNLIQEQATKANLEVLDLTALVESQLFDAYDQLTARHLTLTPELAAHVHLLADPLLMRRIIQNLVGNWLKYARGQLTVRLTQPDADHVQLVFANQTDQDLSQLSRLTERFFTTDQARQDSTGLGLAIVQALTTQMGGKLTLSSHDDWFVAILIFRRPVAE